jgi:FkbM family methyltransferase
MYRTHFDIEQIREAAHCLCDFHDALEDDDSVAVWKGLVRYRLTLDPAYIVTSEYPQYLSPLTAIEPGDAIVDGGAWIGDSAQAFIDAVDGHCRVFAFEPAAPNFLRLTNENASLIASGRIIPVNKGLWDKATTFRINTSFENSGRSKLDQKGEESIDLIRLDDYFEKDQIVSAIKFDLEGAEQQGLAGASETIRNQRPRLMLSIYHHGNDFWEIFRQLKTIHPDYQVSLGHHSASMFETVLYAR